MKVADRIIGAFPHTMGAEVEAVAYALASRGATLSPHSFSVTVGPLAVAIPERLYVDEMRGGDATACFFTRHHNGLVRQRALAQVLLLDEPWVAPFVVRLVGEYVIEIIEQIDEAYSAQLPRSLSTFVSANPDFIRLTRARVTSYWNCYFRTTPLREHVGFRVMDRIEAAAYGKA